MTEYNFDKTKGQSAIEYLMTYGWMLLVVAIVGGAIFATVQGQCTQSTSGYSGGDVLVENFGTDGDGQLQLEIRNGGSDTLEINEVEIENNGGDSITTDGDLDMSDSDFSVGVSSSNTLTLEHESESLFEPSDGCNDFDIEFNYDQGSLEDQVISGSLTDSIEFGFN